MKHVRNKYDFKFSWTFYLAKELYPKKTDHVIKANCIN